MLPDIFEALPNMSIAAQWQQANLGLLNQYAQSGAAIQSALTPGASRQLQGYCHACAAQRTFVVDFAYSDGVHINWRERVVCEACGLNNRLRATLKVLDTLGRGRQGYLTEHLTPFARYMREREQGLMTSEFVDADLEPGHISPDGVRHEDLTRLSFPDNAFDYLVCCDVLEHIPDYQAALSQMYRVLRPGSLVVLTAPFDPTSQRHLVRASVVGGEVRHHCPPEFHGDPMGGAGILCYYHFGWDLLNELAAVGFHTPEVLVVASEREANFCGPQLFFIAHR